MLDTVDQESPRKSLVPVCRLGGMIVSRLSQQETVELMADIVEGKHGDLKYPIFMTSSNGQVLSRYASDENVRRVYDKSDVISADGQPMVFASKFLLKNPVKDRCSTTDLFHTASRRFAKGTRYFMLGATAEQIDAAVFVVQKTYPHIDVVGYSDGYFGNEEEEELVARINSLKPDVLWIGLGVPRQQEFVVRNRDRFSNVKVIKTCGGLFNFLSGKNSRAPRWMQRGGLEWVYRLSLEPRRLFWRYLISNPHSVYLLLTQTGEVENGDQRNFTRKSS